MNGDNILQRWPEATQHQPTEHATLLCESERRLHRPAIPASADEVSRLLADDFFEFGASGSVWRRQQIIDSVAREKNQPADELSASDFSPHWLAEGVALVTYRGVRGAFHANRANSTALRSSIWKCTDGRWQMVFHQGTPTPPVTSESGGVRCANPPSSSA